METAWDILQAKASRALVAATPDTSVRQATMLMNDHGIGSLLVLEGRRLVGIFTERDVLRRVVAESRPPDATPLRAVMTTDVLRCSIEAPVEELADMMRRHRVRHLPVVDTLGDVVGLVSIGDVNAHRFACCETALHQVQDYIHRRA